MARVMVKWKSCCLEKATKAKQSNKQKQRNGGGEKRNYKYSGSSLQDLPQSPSLFFLSRGTCCLDLGANHSHIFLIIFIGILKAPLVWMKAPKPREVKASPR
jgi:hypothetical protein